MTKIVIIDQFLSVEWGPFSSCGPGVKWLRGLGFRFEREPPRVQHWLGIATGLGRAGKDQFAGCLKGLAGLPDWAP